MMNYDNNNYNNNNNYYYKKKKNDYNFNKKLLVTWLVLLMLLITITATFLLFILAPSTLDASRSSSGSRSGHSYDSVKQWLLQQQQQLRFHQQQQQQQQKQQQQQQQQQQQHRIAIIIPFVGEEASSIPPYFDLFCTAASGSHPLVDFIIVHDGVLESYHQQQQPKQQQQQQYPHHQILHSNIHLINLGSTHAMSRALLRVLDHPLQQQQQPRVLAMDRDKLIQILTKYLQQYPYILVEFKPALGFVFQEYLFKQQPHDSSSTLSYAYTHWGYADMDMIFGDLPRWITTDELEQYDIVTYGFGDQHRLYLRGQFTFHKISSTTTTTSTNTDSAAITTSPKKITTFHEHDQQPHDGAESSVDAVVLPTSVPSSLLYWIKCDHLSKLDQRFASVLAGTSKLQFESAEGCYSSVVLEPHQQQNLKVKYAVKAFTDIEDHDTANTHGLYITLDQDKTIIYKPHYRNSNNQKQQQQLISTSWFYALPYASHQQPLQSQVGERQRIIVPWQQQTQNGQPDLLSTTTATTDTNTKKCMYWAMKKYQSKLCLDPQQESQHVPPSHTVYWIDGNLYKQRHENVILPVDTAPFFHFQEWKRFYRSSQLTSLSRNNPYVNTFLLTKEGVIPVLSKSHYPPQPPPPLQQQEQVQLAQQQQKYENQGIFSWPLRIFTKHGGKENDSSSSDNNNNIRHRLPHYRYCLQSAPRKFPRDPPAPECLFATSWQDETAVKLLSVPSWKYSTTTTSMNHYNHEKNSKDDDDDDNMVDLQHDVTLIITLQISAQQANHAQVLKGMLDLAIANIRSWQGQPCVVLLDVAGVVDVTALEVLQNHLSLAFGGGGIGGIGTTADSGSNGNLLLDNCLLAAIYRKDEGIVSRKALLNMAQDAAPTRWTVSGLEIERGMVLASDACYFVHETVRAYRTNPGHVFWIPQFAFVQGMPDDINNNNNNAPAMLSLHGLLESKQRGLLSTELAKLEDKGRCEDDETMVDPFESVTALWWDSLQDILGTPTSAGGAGLGASDGSAGSNGGGGPKASKTEHRALAIDEIELSLMKLLTSAAHYQLFAMDLSPILLVDNLGPRPGMRTLQVAREVEEFGGKQCYNGLRLAQLVTMGYHFNVVSGAFAASTVPSRQVAFARVGNDNNGGNSNNNNNNNSNTPGSSRCDGCFMFDSEHDAIVESIARDERQRPAKAAVLWDELLSTNTNTDF